LTISDAINAPPALPPSAEMAAEIRTAPTPLLDADGYLGLNSQYVYRGVALRTSPLLTAALVISTREGWFVDVWGGRVDTVNYYYGDEIAREWLVDVNVGYSAALSRNWQWSLSRAWINGFDNRLPESQNYQEWRANLFYKEDIALQFAYTDNYRQLGWAAWNVEASDLLPLTPLINGEIGVGHSHGAGGADNSYNYGWLGVQGVLSKTEWNLRFFHSDNNAEQVLDKNRAGNRIELSLSWHLSFSH
jgi:hypothetical protein